MRLGRATVHCVVAAFCGVSLGIASFVAPVAAQEVGRGGQGRDGREVARGDDGDTITYTIIETPDSNPGDATTPVSPVSPATPAAPDLSRVPVPPENEPPPVVQPVVEPAAAPLDGSQDIAPVGEATVAETVPLTATCLDFGSWYDAQVSYEAAGGTAAGPDLVGALDLDADGVACEELIEYS